MKITTLFQNLFEAETERTDADVKVEVARIVKTLRKKCGPWVEAYTENHDLVFYRGYNAGASEDENFVLKRARKNRTPRDSQVLAHRLFNKILSDFGNNPKWRSNSVFVSTDKSISTQYGPTWIMIPVGNFGALTSNSIVDLYTLFDPTAYNDFRHIGKFTNAEVVSRSVLDDWIQKSKKTPVYSTVYNGIADFIEKLLPTDIDAKNLSSARRCIRSTINNIYDVDCSVLIELMLHFGGRIYYFGSASAALSNAEQYMTDFVLNWASLYHSLRAEFQKAELNIDLVGNYKAINNFDRLRDNFVRKLIIDNSDALVQLYVDMLATCVRHSYTYYVNPSEMHRLSVTSQEIMIRCDEYYLIKPHIFDFVERELAGGAK